MQISFIKFKLIDITFSLHGVYLRCLESESSRIVSCIMETSAYPCPLHTRTQKLSHQTGTIWLTILDTCMPWGKLSPIFAAKLQFTFLRISNASLDQNTEKSNYLIGILWRYQVQGTHYSLKYMQNEFQSFPPFIQVNVLALNLPMKYRRQ